MKDRAGNTSAALSTASITLDTAAPQNGALTVVDHRSGAVTPDLQSDGVFDLVAASLLAGRFDLDVAATAGSAFSIVVDGPAGAAVLSGALPEAGLVFPASGALAVDGTDDGLYELFGTVSDAAGNSLTLPSLFIDLDTQAPCVDATLLLNGDATPAPASSGVVAVSLGCAVAAETPVFMQLGCDGAAADEPLIPFAATATCALQDGDRTVTAIVFDGAGNSRATTTASVTVDRVPPSVPRFDGTASITSTAAITVPALASQSTDNVGGAGLRTPPYDVLIPATAPGDACPAALGGVASAEGFCTWNGLDAFTAPLLPGENRLKVIAVDRAANRSDDDQLVVQSDEATPGVPVISRLALLGDAVVLEFALPDTDDAADVDHFEVFYGATDTAIAGDNLGGAFLNNGASPLDVGQAQVVRLLGAPVGQPLFVTVRAVDAAGNTSRKAAIAAVDVEPLGTEIMANISPDQLGVFRGLELNDDNQSALVAAPLASGFEVYVYRAPASGIGPKSRLQVTFPAGVGLTPALFGTLFGVPRDEGNQCGGTPQTIYAAVIVRGRPDQARFGDVLVYELGSDCDIRDGNTGRRSARLVESFAVLGEPVDLQSASGTATALPRLAWLEHIKSATENGADLVIADVFGDGVARRTRTAAHNVNGTGVMAIQLPPTNATLDGLGIAANAQLTTEQLSFALLDDGASAVVLAVLDSSDSGSDPELTVGVRVDLTADGRFAAPRNGQRHKGTTLAAEPDVNPANTTDRYAHFLGRAEPVIEAGGATAAWFTLTPSATSEPVFAPQCARRVSLDQTPGSPTGMGFDNVAVGFVAGSGVPVMPVLQARSGGGAICQRAGLPSGVGAFRATIGVIERRDVTPPLIVALARDNDDDASNPSGNDGIGSRMAVFSANTLVTLSQGDLSDTDAEDVSPLPAPVMSTWSITRHGNELQMLRPEVTPRFFGNNVGAERGALLSMRIPQGGVPLEGGLSTENQGPILDSFVADGFLHLVHRGAIVTADLANLERPRTFSTTDSNPKARAAARFGHVVYTTGLSGGFAFNVSQPDDVTAIPGLGGPGGTDLAVSPGGPDAVGGTVVQAPPTLVTLFCTTPGGPIDAFVDCADDGALKTAFLQACTIDTAPGTFGALDCSTPPAQISPPSARTATNLQVSGTSAFVLVAVNDLSGGVFTSLHQRSVADLRFVDRCLPSNFKDNNGNGTLDTCDPDANQNDIGRGTANVTAYSVDGAQLAVVVEDSARIAPDDKRLLVYDVAPSGFSTFGPRILLHANNNALNLDDIASTDNVPAFYDVGIGDLTQRSVTTVMTSAGVAFFGPIVTDASDDLEVPAMATISLGTRQGGFASDVPEPAQVLSRQRFSAERIHEVPGGFVAVDRFLGATVFVPSKSDEVSRRFSATLAGTEATRGTASRRIDMDKAVRFGDAIVTASLDADQPHAMQCRQVTPCRTDFPEQFQFQGGAPTGQVDLLNIIDGTPTLIGAFPDPLEKREGPAAGDNDLDFVWVLDVAVRDAVTAILVDHVRIPAGSHSGTPTTTFAARREVVLVANAPPLLGRFIDGNGNRERTVFDWASYRVTADSAGHRNSVIGRLALLPNVPAGGDLRPSRLLLDRDHVVLIDDASDRVVSVPLNEVTDVARTTNALLARTGVAQAAGLGVRQENADGGVLTFLDGSGSAPIMRQRTVAGLIDFNPGRVVAGLTAADRGVPLAVRGSQVYSVGAGELFAFDRLSGDVAAQTFEFFSPMKALLFSDNRVVGSVVVNDTSVTGAFARVALIEPTYGNDDKVASMAETSSFVSGIDPTNRGGGLVDFPWGQLFFDRGTALRVLTTTE